MTEYQNNQNNQYNQNRPPPPQNRFPQDVANTQITNNPNYNDVNDKMIAIINSGNITDILQFFQSNMFSNFTSKDGNTPVHQIISLNNNQINQFQKIELIKQLKKSPLKINIDKVNNQNTTPLHIAIENQYEHIVQYLLDEKADPNKININNQNALHLALMPNIKVCSAPLFVKPIIKPNQQDEDKNKIYNMILKQLYEHIEKIDSTKKLIKDYEHVINRLDLLQKDYSIGNKYLILKNETETSFQENPIEIALKNIQNKIIELTSKAEYKISDIKKNINEHIKTSLISINNQYEKFVNNARKEININNTPFIQIKDKHNKIAEHILYTNNNTFIKKDDQINLYREKIIESIQNDINALLNKLHTSYNITRKDLITNDNYINQLRNGLVDNPTNNLSINYINNIQTRQTRQSNNLSYNNTSTSINLLNIFINIYGSRLFTLNKFKYLTKNDLFDYKRILTSSNNYLSTTSLDYIKYSIDSLENDNLNIDLIEQFIYIIIKSVDNYNNSTKLNKIEHHKIIDDIYKELIDLTTIKNSNNAIIYNVNYVYQLEDFKVIPNLNNIFNSFKDRYNEITNLTRIISFVTKTETADVIFNSDKAQIIISVAELITMIFFLNFEVINDLNIDDGNLKNDAINIGNAAAIAAYESILKHDDIIISTVATTFAIVNYIPNEKIIDVISTAAIASFVAKLRKDNLPILYAQINIIIYLYNIVYNIINSIEIDVGGNLINQLPINNRCSIYGTIGGIIANVIYINRVDILNNLTATPIPALHATNDLYNDYALNNPIINGAAAHNLITNYIVGRISPPMQYITIKDYILADGNRNYINGIITNPNIQPNDIVIKFINNYDIYTNNIGNVNAIIALVYNPADPEISVELHNNSVYIAISIAKSNPPLNRTNFDRLATKLLEIAKDGRTFIYENISKKYADINNIKIFNNFVNDTKTNISRYINNINPPAPADPLDGLYVHALAINTNLTTNPPNMNYINEVHSINNNLNALNEIHKKMLMYLILECIKISKNSDDIGIKAAYNNKLNINNTFDVNIDNKESLQNIKCYLFIKSIMKLTYNLFLIFYAKKNELDLSIILKANKININNILIINLTQDMFNNLHKLENKLINIGLNYGINLLLYLKIDDNFNLETNKNFYYILPNNKLNSLLTKQNYNELINALKNVDETKQPSLYFVILNAIVNDNTYNEILGLIQSSNNILINDDLNLFEKLKANKSYINTDLYSILESIESIGRTNNNIYSNYITDRLSLDNVYYINNNNFYNNSITITTKILDKFNKLSESNLLYDYSREIDPLIQIQIEQDLDNYLLINKHDKNLYYSIYISIKNIESYIGTQIKDLNIDTHIQEYIKNNNLDKLLYNVHQHKYRILCDYLLELIEKDRYKKLADNNLIFSYIITAASYLDNYFIKNEKLKEFDTNYKIKQDYINTLLINLDKESYDKITLDSKNRNPFVSSQDDKFLYAFNTNLILNTKYAIENYTIDKLLNDYEHIQQNSISFKYMMFYEKKYDAINYLNNMYNFDNKYNGPVIIDNPLSILNKYISDLFSDFLLAKINYKNVRLSHYIIDFIYNMNDAKNTNNNNLTNKILLIILLIIDTCLSFSHIVNDLTINDKNNDNYKLTVYIEDLINIYIQKSNTDIHNNTANIPFNIMEAILKYFEINNKVRDTLQNRLHLTPPVKTSFINYINLIIDNLISLYADMFEIKYENTYLNNKYAIQNRDIANGYIKINNTVLLNKQNILSKIISINTLIKELNDRINNNNNKNIYNIFLQSVNLFNNILVEFINENTNKNLHKNEIKIIISLLKKNNFNVDTYKYNYENHNYNILNVNRIQNFDIEFNYLNNNLIIENYEKKLFNNSITPYINNLFQNPNLMLNNNTLDNNNIYKMRILLTEKNSYIYLLLYGMPLFIEFKYINKLIYDDFYDHYSNNYTDTFKKYHDIAYFQHILYIYSDINNKLLTDVNYYGLDNLQDDDNNTLYLNLIKAALINKPNKTFEFIQIELILKKLELSDNTIIKNKITLDNYAYQNEILFKIFNKARANSILFYNKIDNIKTNIYTEDDLDKLKKLFNLLDTQLTLLKLKNYIHDADTQVPDPALLAGLPVAPAPLGALLGPTYKNPTAGPPVLQPNLPLYEQYIKRTIYKIYTILFNLSNVSEYYMLEVLNYTDINTRSILCDLITIFGAVYQLNNNNRLINNNYHHVGADLLQIIGDSVIRIAGADYIYNTYINIHYKKGINYILQINTEINNNRIELSILKCIELINNFIIKLNNNKYSEIKSTFGPDPVAVALANTAALKAARDAGINAANIVLQEAIHNIVNISALNQQQAIDAGIGASDAAILVPGTTREAAITAGIGASSVFLIGRIPPVFQAQVDTAIAAINEAAVANGRAYQAAIVAADAEPKLQQHNKIKVANYCCIIYL